MGLATQAARASQESREPQETPANGAVRGRRAPAMPPCATRRTSRESSTAKDPVFDGGHTMPAGVFRDAVVGGGLHNLTDHHDKVCLKKQLHRKQKTEGLMDQLPAERS